MEFNKCYACFRDLPADEDVCPHCGYNVRTDPEAQPPCALRCGTILAGRYFLGRMIDRTNFEIVYIAYDLAQEKRVCVRELFPDSLAARTASESRKVSWNEERAEECQRAYQSYVSETGRAKKLQGLEHVAGISDVFRENNTAYCVTDSFEGASLKSRAGGRAQPLDDKNGADPKPAARKKPALWPKLLGAAAVLAAVVIVWSVYGKGGDKTTEGTVTATPAVTLAPTVKPTTTPAATAKPAATPAPTVKPTATPAPTAKPTVKPTAADAARKVEEQIAALGEITADSESRVRAARAAYDALSEDAKKAVGNLSVLTGAEETLRTLLDTQALAEIKRLYSGGDYEGTIEYAEAYFADRDLKTFSDDFFDYVVWAYTLAAQEYEYDSEYEKAQKLLEKGVSLYAETAYGDKAREALEHLNDKIRANEPSNGKIMRATANSGYGELEIKNGGSNALIKLESFSQPETYYLEFYVRENETVTVNVRDGLYQLKYATGKTWYSEKELFGSATAYTKADTLVSFETTYSGSYVNYDINQITLYKVQNGNLSTSPISKDDF